MNDAISLRAPRGALLVVPALMLFAGMLLVPLLMVGALSIHEFSSAHGVQATFTAANFLSVLTDSYYLEIFARTLWLSLCVTGLTLLFGVPETLVLARMRAPWRGIFLVVLLCPLLISVVVRTLGWAILLGNNGLINGALTALGLVDQPVGFMYSFAGMVIGLTHIGMPFMVVAVWASLQRLDPQMEQAAASFGAGPLTVFFRVTLPQIVPGILSGAIIVFAMSASSFATPALLGGRRLKVVATVTYDEFLSTLNWPLGAAIALILLGFNLFLIGGLNRLVERQLKHLFSA